MSEIATLDPLTQTETAATQDSALTEEQESEAGKAVLAELDGSGSDAATETDESKAQKAGESKDKPDAELQALIEAERKAEREQAQREERERLESEAAAKTKSDKAQNDRRAIKQAFDDRAPAVRAYLKEQQLEDGPVNMVMGAFEEHHAQLQGYYKAAYWDALHDVAKDVLGDGYEKWRQSDQAGQFSDAIKALLTAGPHGREGFVSPSEATAREARAAYRAKKAEQQKALDLGSAYLEQLKPVVNRGGMAASAAGGSFRSLSEAAAMYAERHVSGRTISREQYRQAKAAHAAGSLPD